MIIKLSQNVFLKDRPRTFRTAHKSFDSNVIPRKGDFISDTAFKAPYEHEVVEVTIDYQDDVCYVSLHSVEIESEDEAAVLRYLEIYKMHDWNYLEF